MIDELAIPSRSEESDKFRQFLVAHGGPAFLRRAAEVSAAYESLLHHCRRQRTEWLSMIGLRLAQLQGQPARVRAPLLQCGQLLTLLVAQQQTLIEGFDEAGEDGSWHTFHAVPWETAKKLLPNYTLDCLPLPKVP